MTDTQPSSRGALKSTCKNLVLSTALISSFFFGSAFSELPNPVIRANSAEAMQLRTFISGWGQNYTGIQYHYAGRSPQTGFDCSGFTSFVMEEFGVKISPSSAKQSTQGIEIGLDEVLPGDLVFFGRGKHIQHVALVVEKTPEGIICVHSTSSRGVVVENISTSSYWRPRIMFARDVISTQPEALALMGPVRVEPYKAPVKVTYDNRKDR